MASGWVGGSGRGHRATFGKKGVRATFSGDCNWVVTCWTFFECAKDDLCTSEIVIEKTKIPKTPIWGHAGNLTISYPKFSLILPNPEENTGFPRNILSYEGPRRSNLRPFYHHTTRFVENLKVKIEEQKDLCGVHQADDATKTSEGGIGFQARCARTGGVFSTPEECARGFLECGRGEEAQNIFSGHSEFNSLDAVAVERVTELPPTPPQQILQKPVVACVLLATTLVPNQAMGSTY